MDRNEIVRPENLVYKKPTLMNEVNMHYCPGCSHGVVHKLVAEVIEEMGLEEKSVGVSPVGCAVFAYRYIDIDWQEAAHGRAPAVATAIKRLWPDRLVFTYQGDGDLACIGTCETIHALNRGENIVIIFVNNAIYGMTGGQMPLRTRPQTARISPQDARNRSTAPRHMLRHTPVRRHRRTHQQSQESHTQSLRSLNGRQRIMPRRNHIHLQQRMETLPAESLRLDERKHDTLLPAGRLERYN